MADGQVDRSEAHGKVADWQEGKQFNYRQASR
jgi:hypothetical protein